MVRVSILGSFSKVKIWQIYNFENERQALILHYLSGDDTTYVSLQNEEFGHEDYPLQALCSTICCNLPGYPYAHG